jgi:hypothetical protein
MDWNCFIRDKLFTKGSYYAEMGEDMLTVNSAKFYKNDNDKERDMINVGEENDELEFKDYPVTQDLITLVVDYHPIGEVKDKVVISVRFGEQVIHTEERELELQDGKDEYRIYEIRDITFPSSGPYEFDIVFEDKVLKSVPLRLT